MVGLNDKQQSFVEHYCTDAAFNASAAYRIAYPLAKTGQKENGCRLLTKDNVKAAIEEYKADLAWKDEKSRINIDKRFNERYIVCVSNSDNPNAIKCLENMAKHRGYYEKDNVQQQTRLQIAIKAEQVAIDAALAKALDDAPDALAR